MTKKLLCLVPAVLAAGFAQTQSPITREGSCWVQTVKGSVSAARAQHLHITTWGNISAEGVDSDALSYTLRKQVRARTGAEAARLLERIRTGIRTEGNMLRVDVACPAQSRGILLLTVAVPRRLAKTRLETRGGNVEVRGVGGELVAESAGGRIVADEIRGALVAETGGGEIQVGSVEGSIRCISGAGGIRVDRAGGEAWLETAGGEIHVGEAEGPIHASTGGGNIYVRRAASSVTTHTAGGVIEVSEAGGQVIAETAGGLIQISSARGVKCESAEGAIRLRRVSGALRASTAAGNILAELAGGMGLENSFLDTVFGDVTVLIPSNIAVTVKADNVRGGKGGRIISDFPEVRVDPAGRSGFGPVRAQGAINGGGPVLRISATGGTIYLRRR